MSICLNDIENLYRDSNICALATDEKLSVLWCNGAALQSYPTLKLPDGFNMLFPQAVKETFLAVKSPAIFTLDSIKLNITVTPLSEGMVFTLTDIRGKSDSELYSKAERLLLNPISTLMRTEVSEVFTLASTLAVIGETEDDERIYDISKSINTNCYALLRTSNLLSSYFEKLHPTTTVKEYIDLNALVENICSAAGVITADVGIPLIFSSQCAETIILGNVDSISESIINLISNACKFSSNGSKIEVRFEKNDKTATIIIKDYGIGIPPQIFPWIFEPFFSYNRDKIPFSGLGLGLTLARLNILNSGGTLTITSKDYEGTTAMISLPLSEDFINLTLKSPPSLSSMLRDRFSQLHILMADCGKVPLP